MWNGLRTQEALEGGVFRKTSFLSVGTAEEPCPYTAKEPQPERYKGKQFGTQAPKTSKVPKDFFDPTYKPLFEGETYVDRLPYQELQPDKPAKGFLTSDFSKRDEFSMTLRAQQLREQIKHEARVQKLAEQKLAASGAGAAAAAAAAASAAPKAAKQAPLLFDLVFEGETELCIKAKRDTRNPTMLSTERQLGSFRTTNSVHQAAVTAHSPPKAAGGSPAADSKSEGTPTAS
ncbi:flagellar associated [Micractinium conductrix]|uniref:Flagellar associated n=1 Tax=Micractinium conductrix TaxID=554055 RepID=A0A2P6VGI4_9CHLO|nr:flagellar associated [Micractinium conductrix]|eukprot:PSC73188.1 flagellar associated [Micractinium conductrix]